MEGVTWDLFSVEYDLSLSVTLSLPPSELDCSLLTVGRVGLAFRMVFEWVHSPKITQVLCPFSVLMASDLLLGEWGSL